jgi:hypothetical protein
VVTPTVVSMSWMAWDLQIWVAILEGVGPAGSGASVVGLAATRLLQPVASKAIRSTARRQGLGARLWSMVRQPSAARVRKPAPSSAVR